MGVGEISRLASEHFHISLLSVSAPMWMGRGGVPDIPGWETKISGNCSHLSTGVLVLVAVRMVLDDCMHAPFLDTGLAFSCSFVKFWFLLN